MTLLALQLQNYARNVKKWVKFHLNATVLKLICQHSSLIFNNMTPKVRDVLHTSSLPSILDSYTLSEGFEKTARVVRTVMQLKKLQARKDKEAVLHSSPDADSDEAAEAKQKVLQDQRHLETYHRIHRLRDRLSHHYAVLLREKVQRQRLEIKLHDSDTLKNRAKCSEQRARKLTIQKLAGSGLEHDNAYLRALPKTRYYLILELQRLLSQRGCLKGPKEQEVFRSWVDQHKTAQLEKQLQQMALCSKSAPEMKLEDLLKMKQEVLPKIQISTDENHQEEQEHQSAVSESGGGAQAGSPHLHGKQSQEQDHTELKFPSVLLQEIQVPRFSTLQPSFLETFKTNIRLLKVKEPLHKSTAAASTQHKLRLMHSLSLSHMAHTHRLLDKKGLALQHDDGYSINDLLERVCLSKISTKEPRFSTEPALPPLSLKDSPERFKEKLSTSSDQVTSSPQFEDSKLSCSGASDPEVPLSMEDICPLSISQGEDFDKKTWTNYVS
ncbi:uncharacterized protein si:ch211-130h14.4 isoform X3 [Pygocentrus nattereri]|uniref:uncharacterized protein si:ch211-130h14.4 isoform X3 n=1 Tax=Pygocentrus nattereri TaxID=42514 RepID=UPI000814A283|nr:uncharacterized protein si:ch211-130h14.4 isoform X3 [Pygocentrus nattereri]